MTMSFKVVLWGVLQEYGVDNLLPRAIRSLSQSLVRIAGSKSDLFLVRVGLRQGCPLLPFQFITFSRHIKVPEGACLVVSGLRPWLLRMM